MNDERIFDSQIVHKNFFMYLDLKKISQKKYAEDNKIDRSLVSKWKTNSSCMTIDQIYRAAEYLGLTINDLVYSENDKSRRILLADKSFTPIKAQNIIRQLLLDYAFNRPQYALIVVVFTNILLGIISLLSVGNDTLWIIIVLLAGPLGWYAAKKASDVYRTYIINYIDEIYYSIKEPVVSRKWVYVLMLIVATVLFVCQIAAINPYIQIDERTGVIGAIYVLVIFIHFIVSIAFILVLPKELPPIMYSDEADGFAISRLLMSFTIYETTLFALIMFFAHQIDYYAIGIQVALLVLFVLIYFMVSKQYSEYELTYDEYGKEPRQLPIYRDE